MNDHASGKGHSQWCRDYGDAWHAQLRLQGLARGDQVTQNRLNSTPIAQRRPWCGGPAVVSKRILRTHEPIF